MMQNLCSNSFVVILSREVGRILIACFPFLLPTMLPERFPVMLKQLFAYFIFHIYISSCLFVEASSVKALNKEIWKRFNISKVDFSTRTPEWIWEWVDIKGMFPLRGKGPKAACQSRAIKRRWLSHLFLPQILAGRRVLQFEREKTGGSTWSQQANDSKSSPLQHKARGT